MEAWGSRRSTHFQRTNMLFVSFDSVCADICTNGAKATVCKRNLLIPQHTWNHVSNCPVSFCNLLPYGLSKRTKESQQHMELPWWSSGLESTLQCKELPWSRKEDPTCLGAPKPGSLLVGLCSRPGTHLFEPLGFTTADACVSQSLCSATRATTTGEAHPTTRVAPARCSWRIPAHSTQKDQAAKK